MDPSLNLTMCKHKKNSLNKPKPGTPQNMQEIPKFSSAAHPATMDPLIPEQYNNKCILFYTTKLAVVFYSEI